MANKRSCGCSLSSISGLIDELNGAKIIMTDTRHNLVLAWFGGHGVHAYDQSGREVAFWNVGDFAKNNASPATVRGSMRRRIKTGDYD